MDPELIDKAGLTEQNSFDQSAWSAYVRLLSVQSPEARTFYEAEALRLGWSVRQLDRQINSQFYERIALSQNKAAMLEKAENPELNDLVTPEEAIKDPFVLEFLDTSRTNTPSRFAPGLRRLLVLFQTSRRQCSFPQTFPCGNKVSVPSYKSQWSPS
jgi:hypothetical protein